MIEKVVLTKSTTTPVILSDGLTVSNLSLVDSVLASVGRETGKWFFEVFVKNNQATMIGVANELYNNENSASSANIKTYYSSGALYPTGTGLLTLGTYTTGDTIGVLINLDEGTLTFYKNGISNGIAFNNLGDFNKVFPLITTGTSSAGGEWVINFGDTAFSYPPSDLPYGTYAYNGKPLNVNFMILKNPSTNQYYSLAEKTLIPFPNILAGNIIAYGIKGDKEINLAEDFDKITTVNSDGTSTTNTVTPFSVYDYISENPQILVYTEATDDIIVSATTEPYSLYDEFGDEVEVLFYTEDESTIETNLIMEANWSPIDELEGDFEVVTWTKEGADTAQRGLGFTAIPVPQFVKHVHIDSLTGQSIESLQVLDVSIAHNDKGLARYLFIDGSSKLYKFDLINRNFTDVTALISSNDDIRTIGMKYDELSLISYDEWKSWNEDEIGIAIYLEDDVHDNYISKVENVLFFGANFIDTPEITDASLYILNTTAKIDIELTGNTIQGSLDDADLTRVQYRVLLNGVSYYPNDGSFTNLSSPPQNIALTFNSNEIKIDDWNTVRVEFKDTFGTTDYWETQFLGTYSGLLFKDIYGNYYSNEIGEVLKYLDFGTVVAGQTTIEHEIILKNQYGYNLKNINLYGNTSSFPTGMKLEFSDSISPFVPSDNLSFSSMVNGEEKSFYVRLSSDLNAVPNNSNLFDLIVKAEKD